MKYIFFSFLFAACFFACSSPSSTSPSHPDSTEAHIDSPVHPSAATSLPPFMKLDTSLPFSGVWVNEIYIRHIRDNRSPRLSQDVMESCIIIPARTLQVTRMVAGFHEGAADMVVVKDREHYKFYSADLTLFRYDIQLSKDNRIRIGDQFFIRLQRPDTTLTDWGILEEILFAGKYLDQRGQPVTFAADGHLSGLGDLSYYIPRIDYATMANQVDHIQLGRTARQLDDFGFRFDKDSLIIYTINCVHYDGGEKQCDSEALGKRLYTLKRVLDDTAKVPGAITLK